MSNRRPIKMNARAESPAGKKDKQDRTDRVHMASNHSQIEQPPEGLVRVEQRSGHVFIGTELEPTSPNSRRFLDRDTGIIKQVPYKSIVEVRSSDGEV